MPQPLLRPRKVGGVQRVQPPGVASSSVPSALEAQRPKLAAVSTQYLDEERLVHLAKALWHKTPGLQRCSNVSFLRAVYTAAQFGLDPTGVGSQAYIIPFGNEATFVRGWGGVITMAARQGIAIETFAAYESDTFEVKRNTGVTEVNHTEWRPEDGGDPGSVIACYAVAFSEAWMHPMVEVVWRHDIEKVRRNSRSGGSPAWKEWYSEMGRKTAVNRLAKRLPLFIQVKEAHLEQTHKGKVWVAKRRTAAPLAEVPAHHEEGEVIDVDPVEQKEPGHDREALLATAKALKEANGKEYKEVFGRRHVSRMEEGELASMISKVEGIISTKEPDVVMPAQIKPAEEYEDNLPF